MAVSVKKAAKTGKSILSEENL